MNLFPSTELGSGLDSQFIDFELDSGWHWFSWGSQPLKATEGQPEHLVWPAAACGPQTSAVQELYLVSAISASSTGKIPKTFVFQWREGKTLGVFLMQLWQKEPHKDRSMVKPSSIQSLHPIWVRTDQTISSCSPGSQYSAQDEAS